MDTPQPGTPLRLLGGALLLSAVFLASCGGGDDPDADSATPSTQETTMTSSIDSAPTGQAVFESFVEAVNAGDVEATRALFAEDARFDSVGRIYSNRDEIFDRFLVPEVIDAGGRYVLLDVSDGQAGRAVAEFDFTTRSGAEEHFTYDCAIADGRFTDCIGRYV